MEATNQDKTAEAMRYKSADMKRQRRYRQISKIPVEDLSGEVHGMRVFAQEAYEQGNAALYNLLTANIGKLAHSQTALKRMNDEFLDRAELRRVAGQLCKIVTTAIQGRVPDWEDIVEQIAAELTAKVEEPCKVEGQHE